jgi:DNA-binding response OmpR family regulator
VDRDESVVSQLEKWLSMFTLFVAHSAPDAMSIVRDPKTGALDLIVTDAFMGSGGGGGSNTFIRELRANHSLSEVPMIVMSSGSGFADWSITNGSQDFISKPLMQRLLLSKVNVLLELRDKKQNERRLSELLDRERAANEKYSERLATLTRDMDVLWSDRSHYLDAPIVIQSRRIVDLLAQNSELALSPLAHEVRQLLALVQSDDWHRPRSFDPRQALDDVTRSYLTSELVHHSSPHDATPAQFIRRNSICDFPGTNVVQAELIAEMKSWHFDVFRLSDIEMLGMLEKMLLSIDVSELDIDVPRLRNFLLGVRNSYLKNNPYHNFRHAFDVTQTVREIYAHTHQTHTSNVVSFYNNPVPASISSIVC